MNDFQTRWEDSDDGNAALVILVFMSVFLIFLLFVEKDNRRNQFDMNRRYEIAQTAAKSAIGNVDANGVLREASVQTFLNEYRKLRGVGGLQVVGGVGTTGYNLQNREGSPILNDGGDRSRRSTPLNFLNDPILHDPSINPGSPFAANDIRCRYVEAEKGADGKYIKRVAPYIVVTLDSRRRAGELPPDKSVRYVSEGLQPFRRIEPPISSAKIVEKPKVLSIRIFDNMIGTFALPLAIRGSDLDKVGCQPHMVKVNAIAFGSQFDLPGDTATP